MRVLLLGNSQMVWNGSVPDLLTRMSASAGDALDVQAVAIGGATMEMLWTDGRPLAAIRGGAWDRVLCHELVYSYGGNGARLREFGLRFHDEARQRGARMVFYASGDVDGSRSTHEAMYADASALARMCAGRVAGGGMAWLRAWRERPQLDFHCADRAHPSDLGYYLNACVIFSALTDRSPIGLDPCSLDGADADFLQRVAWEQALEDRVGERGDGDG